MSLKILLMYPDPETKMLRWADTSPSWQRITKSLLLSSVHSLCNSCFVTRVVTRNFCMFRFFRWSMADAMLIFWTAVVEVVGSGLQLADLSLTNQNHFASGRRIAHNIKKLRSFLASANQSNLIDHVTHLKQIHELISGDKLRSFSFFTMLWLNMS